MSAYRGARALAVHLRHYYELYHQPQAGLDFRGNRSLLGGDYHRLDAVCNAVSVPVIASGGAGGIQDFVELFKKVPKVDAGLAASIFHFGEVAINDLKKELRVNGIDMRI